MRFPWPLAEQDGYQYYLSPLAEAIYDLWQEREAWDAERAADSIRTFAWNVGLAGALALAHCNGYDEASDEVRGYEWRYSP